VKCDLVTPPGRLAMLPVSSVVQMPACTLGGGQARATNRKRRVSGSEIMTNEPNDNARGTRDRFSPYGPAVFPPRASSPIQSSFDARKPALRRAAWFAFVMRPYVFDPCGIVTVLQPSQYCTEGVRRDQPPAQIARLPANSFPHNIALDQWSGSLYVTDSVLGVVWKIPADGGTPTSWGRGPELQRTALFGANGIAIHRGAVWVSNTDGGTIMEIPIQRDGSAGAIRTAVEGLSGGLDNFVLLGNDDTIIAALTCQTRSS
jgi:hypothetical protein